jgi:hypothetical protein
MTLSTKGPVVWLPLQDKIHRLSGIELLSNNGFECASAPPPSGWTQYQSVVTRQSGTRTGGSGLYIGRIAYDGSHAIGLAYQNIVTASHIYIISGWARGDGTAIPRFYITGGGADWVGTCPSIFYDALTPTQILELHNRMLLETNQ